ncbi:AraC family transcriptional regulator [Congregibacter litoralis]|uniref:Transcriptional regulator, AraC family n=1 Tax=Congregibacter litoralis KT71 TaxID=314285 RepID=A4A3Z8_9GAMM|nr:AraC family transcriptional regulator [Congregibacter litoralis]EAQ99421.2 transcriptional regulator, AraC family [Congregibacter litoralis KT71]
MSTATNKVSVSVHFVRAILKHCREAGVDTQALLRAQRIPPRLLSEPQARISVQQLADLQTSAMQALGDESLGYADQVVPLGTWDMMCHAVITTQTLGQALHRYCRFFELMGGGLQLEMVRLDDAAQIKLAPFASAHGAYFSELCLLNTHRFACWLVQEELPLREVHFRHPPSTRAADYRLMFMGNPVSFEKDDVSIIFGASLLDKPVMQTPESLRRYLRHPVLTMLTTSYDFSWTAKVRAQLRQNLLFMPELPDVAAALDLHPQTLRRRLAAEGNTFKQIKSDIRRDTALHFLGKRSLSVEEVAHRAGFSEASAFIRAFKAWTGLTPYAYRKGL